MCSQIEIDRRLAGLRYRGHKLAGIHRGAAADRNHDPCARLSGPRAERVDEFLLRFARNIGSHVGSDTHGLKALCQFVGHTQLGQDGVSDNKHRTTAQVRDDLRNLGQTPWPKGHRWDPTHMECLHRPLRLLGEILVRRHSHRGGSRLLASRHLNVQVPSWVAVTDLIGRIQDLIDVVGPLEHRFPDPTLPLAGRLEWPRLLFGVDLCRERQRSDWNDSKNHPLTARFPSL